jgi:hypothetical protein
MGDLRTAAVGARFVASRNVSPDTAHVPSAWLAERPTSLTMGLSSKGADANARVDAHHS